MFAELLGLEPDQLVAGGNSSLVMMREVLVDLLLHGGVDSERPWGREEKVTFICPVPGYDRHFTLLDWLGIETVTVAMDDDGPDVEEVARLAAADPSIKGMWLVPTYANPTGSVVAQEVAERLASMPTAAPDFKIFWDNAYALHHLTDDRGQDRRHRLAGRGSRPPAPPGRVRLDLEDHLRRRRRGVRGRLGRDGAVVRRPPRQGRPSAPTSSTSCGTCSSSAPPRACATTWPATARSSRRSSPRSTGCCRSGSPAWRSPPGPGPRAATSSASTSWTAPPAG